MPAPQPSLITSPRCSPAPRAHRSLPAPDVTFAPCLPELPLDKHIQRPCVLGAGDTGQRTALPEDPVS